MTQPTPAQATTKQSIAAVLRTLNDNLVKAQELSAEAVNQIESGTQNGAIGSIVPLKEILATADALTKAAIHLHQRSKE